tara:strand:+ start:38 stop:316 length:279 start_codon:yes stop_codon:yes gene_type:complete
MAILGQIRKRSFFLIVVIGMALFAFVISGVFVGSGVSQNQAIGEVNGEKIDFETFNLLVQQTQDYYGLDLITCCKLCLGSRNKKYCINSRIG